MTDYTLGTGLAAPMVPADSDPSILPWESVHVRGQHGTGENFADYHAILVSGPTDHAERWEAFCAGPGETSMHGEFPSAQEARAAVTQHVLDHVDIDQIEEGR